MPEDIILTPRQTAETVNQEAINTGNYESIAKTFEQRKNVAKLVQQEGKVVSGQAAQWSVTMGNLKEKSRQISIQSDLASADTYKTRRLASAEAEVQQDNNRFNIQKRNEIYGKALNDIDNYGNGKDINQSANFRTQEAQNQWSQYWQKERTDIRGKIDVDNVKIDRVNSGFKLDVADRNDIEAATTDENRAMARQNVETRTVIRVENGILDESNAFDYLKKSYEQIENTYVGYGLNRLSNIKDDIVSTGLGTIKSNLSSKEAAAEVEQHKNRMVAYSGLIDDYKNKVDSLTDISAQDKLRYKNAADSLLQETIVEYKTNIKAAQDNQEAIEAGNYDTLIRNVVSNTKTNQELLTMVQTMEDVDPKQRLSMYNYINERLEKPTYLKPEQELQLWNDVNTYNYDTDKNGTKRFELLSRIGKVENGPVKNALTDKIKDFTDEEIKKNGITEQDREFIKANEIYLSELLQISKGPELKGAFLGERTKTATFGLLGTTDIQEEKFLELTWSERAVIQNNIMTEVRNKVKNKEPYSQINVYLEGNDFVKQAKQGNDLRQIYRLQLQRDSGIGNSSVHLIPVFNKRTNQIEWIKGE